MALWVGLAFGDGGPVGVIGLLGVGGPAGGIGLRRSWPVRR